ncbi:Oidioi.mRNA.OKI2018_I69.chr1.g1412.t1.cds [Oikopleura dioica]|uniref:Oidioi.mRNA.OKI2018_I69.chr1.g1412.t1.cds n=1 Tax=Oikopleura dioica TaxID=34765 RepID=A0ABN7SX17_OIKDI|nr:Oidioi.mRNA.OKI2018_I69.chr1.g1412.t1.cds [Oikopleura dioica]
MPFVTELWLLGTVSFATTLTSSYLNTGLESLLLNIFGVGGSTWVIAIYHAFFTIGGISAPLLVQVFKSSDPLKECVSSANNFTGYQKNYTSGIQLDHIDADIIPPYIIVGAIVVASGIFTCVCAVWKLVEKLTTAKHDESFIYYYVLCSETFDWDPVQANHINMIFWAAFIVGRFSGSYAARKLKPTFLILIYFTGSTVGISMILGVDSFAGGSSKGPLLSTATVIYGLFVSQLYASCTCLCNSFTNMGLSYVFINNLGSSIGTMIAPTVTGKYIEDSPISFAWACFVFCTCGLFFEALVHLEGFRIMQGTSYSKTLKAFFRCSFPVEGFGRSASKQRQSAESGIKEEHNLFS